MKGNKPSHKIKRNNTENSLFYNALSLDLFLGFAVKGGLESGCDLDIIKNYITRANSILEVGAGYGRVISNLLKRGYNKKLVAIERSPKFCETLTHSFSSEVEIIHTDIKSFKTSTQFELILWLWSGICDFSKQEQAAVLSHIASFLKKDGVMVLDSLLPSTKAINTGSHENQYSIIPGEKNLNMYVYTPTPEEIVSYAEKAGLNFTKSIPYTTSTDRPRMLYLLSARPLHENERIYEYSHG
jgi:SAM-dependent methyltransferase